MTLPAIKEHTTNGQLVEQSTAQLFERSGPVPSFADAIISLQHAVTDMRADDLSFEVSSNAEGFQMRLRAYKHRR